MSVDFQESILVAGQRVFSKTYQCCVVIIELDLEAFTAKIRIMKAGIPVDYIVPMDDIAPDERCNQFRT